MVPKARSPWLVSLAVFVVAAVAVVVVLLMYRTQVRKAEELLFQRSVEITQGQFRLITARQMGWLGTLRSRVSNRPVPPERILETMVSPGAWVTLPTHCRALGYGALEEGRIVLRWQRVTSGAAFGALGDDLLSGAQWGGVLHETMSNSPSVQSGQVGKDLFTTMTVADSPQSPPRGWLLAVWDLGAICADPQLKLTGHDGVLTVRPFEKPPRPTEDVIEIGEGEVHWKAAIGKGSGFENMYPRLSERAVLLAGGGCAVLLALLAGLATRDAGLRAALAGERELGRVKDHLLHSLSHEFRTPLSVILSSTELLESYFDRLSAERRAGGFAQIRGCVSRMSEMIEQALLLGRIEARRFPVEPRDVDVAGLAREVAREVETVTQSCCPVQVDAPDHLQATVDPTLLRAVLGNLLSNAVKFSPAGKQVDFSIREDGGLHFLIRDQGPGITAEDLPRVREAYYRSPAASAVPGTGLGLTIADKCAALLGGTLSIESDDTGTTATLSVG